MYFWKYILAKKAGLSQKKCNMALYGLPVLPIAEAFEKTVTGNPISVSDALAQDALSLQVSFTPTQDGTPSIDSEPTTEPYLSKVVPRGNKEYYSLVGATVAWNQLVQNGDFASTSGWSPYTGTINVADNECTYTFSSLGSDVYTNTIRRSDINRVKDHVYLVKYDFYTDKNNVQVNTLYFGSVSKTKTVNNGWSEVCGIGKNTGYTTSAASIYFGVAYASTHGFEVGDTYKIKNAILIDITACFGSSTIADYINSLEQATTGAGVQWLKDNGFFTEDYYPYNPGELISVNTSGHKIGSTTYPIDNIDLRGLFKLSNGKLYCEGDIYPPSGSVERKFDESELSELAWEKATYSSNVYYQAKASLEYAKGADAIGNIIGYCTAYSLTNVSGLPDNNCITFASTYVGSGKTILVRDDAISSTTELVNKLTDKGEIVFKLVTPTTESATPYTSPIDVEAGGTEELIDSRTVPIPVGNETYYASEFEIHGKTGVTVSHGATQDDPNPTEHEVEFTSQSTVYGGTVDIVSGELSVNYGITDLGALNWQKSDSTVGGFYATMSGYKYGTDTDMKCSVYTLGGYCDGTAAHPYYETNGGIKYWYKNGRLEREIYIYDLMRKDLTALQFKTAVNGTILAYELAAPLTYQLTAQQVQMLLGNNYLETEDGTITITYMAGK